MPLGPRFRLPIGQVSATIAALVLAAGCGSNEASDGLAAHSTPQPADATCIDMWNSRPPEGECVFAATSLMTHPLGAYITHHSAKLGRATLVSPGNCVIETGHPREGDG